MLESGSIRKKVLFPVLNISNIFPVYRERNLNKPKLCYSFRYANVEFYVDDILVEKKAKSYEMGYTNWLVGFDLGYNVAEPLKIGSKLKLVWKGEPYTTSDSSTLKAASYRAEIAQAEMIYKFLGGKTLNYVELKKNECGICLYLELTRS